uniref:Amine oxidase n=1 Tax=Zonotrichia albicollis TaxID=44394 RepID=A0A8D2M9J9_ZONAL
PRQRGRGGQGARHGLHQLLLPPWPRYQLAVTRRKEEEPASTSVYNQNDPWTPTVAFADFINNETITNQDLVAWITVGFLHVPHAEDIPNTVTVGNSVGFFLRRFLPGNMEQTGQLMFNTCSELC